MARWLFRSSAPTNRLKREVIARHAVDEARRAGYRQVSCVGVDEVHGFTTYSFVFSEPAQFDLNATDVLAAMAAVETAAV